MFSMRGTSPCSPGSPRRPSRVRIAPSLTPPTAPSATGGSLSNAGLPVVAFGSSGARIKVMRHVRLDLPCPGSKGMSGSGTGDATGDGRAGPASHEPHHVACDVGFGVNFDFDTAALQPSARVKLGGCLSLKLLPMPAVKFQRRFVMGATGVALRVAYECPLSVGVKPWEPPATLLVQLESAAPHGVHLTPAGLELDGVLTLPGRRCVLLGRGRIRLPTQIPLPDDASQSVALDIDRLGLKAAW